MTKPKKLPKSKVFDIILFVENLRKEIIKMATYKIRLSNPSSHQTGQVTVKSWDKDAAISEAKAKLAPMGFTTVLSCEVM